MKPRKTVKLMDQHFHCPKRQILEAHAAVARKGDFSSKMHLEAKSFTLEVEASRNEIQCLTFCQLTTQLPNLKECLFSMV